MMFQNHAYQSNNKKNEDNNNFLLLKTGHEYRIEQTSEAFTYLHDEIINPELHPVNDLLSIYENSEILPQCVAAKELGVVGNGYSIQERKFTNSIRNRSDNSEIELEKAGLSLFLANINADYGFDKLLKLIYRDTQIFGYSFMEIVRNGVGEIKELHHIPAEIMRLSAYDKEQSVIDVKLVVGDKIVMKPMYKQLRRYLIENTGTPVWFKSFGDKRVIDSRSGKETTGPIKFSDRATEIIFFHQTRGLNSLYPKPPWYGVALSVLGSRTAQQVNYTYLHQGNLENLLILMPTGSHVSKKYTEQLTQELQKNKGLNGAGKWLIIQTEDGEGAVPKVERLNSNLLQDGKFLEYKKVCLEDVISAFRIPPILLGRSSDYNRASSLSAKKMFEENVCQQERYHLQQYFSKLIFPELGIRFHDVIFNSPNLSNSAELAKVLETFNTIGGLTPNEARRVYNDLNNADLPIINEKWGDLPYVQGKL